MLTTLLTGPLSLATLAGAAPSALLTGLELLFLFAALLHGSVYLTLAWTIAAPLLLAAGLEQHITGTRVQVCVLHL